MIEVLHYRQGTQWAFESADVPQVLGGGHTLAQSIDAAHHCVRHYLSQELGCVADYEYAAQKTRHVWIHEAGVTRATSPADVAA